MKKNYFLTITCIFTKVMFSANISSFSGFDYFLFNFGTFPEDLGETQKNKN